MSGDTDDPVAHLPPLRETIARHGMAARKGLGQHFLLDLNLTRRIARAAAPLDGGTVIEIGPGPGGLTRALLLEGAAQLVAVDRDERCREALADLMGAAGGRMTLVEADALTVDLADLGEPPRKIVANLPYNVGTALLLRWLETPETVSEMVLMFQKEVAERLAARPGSGAYGRLSVLAQWLCRVEKLFNLPARAFTPPPKVASSVIRLVPRAEPLYPAPRRALERVTAAAFGQRRKMLRRSLAAISKSPEHLLEVASIDPTRRAETLSIEEFATLASAFAETVGTGQE